MPELIKNEIRDNKISEKVGEINRLEKKIKETYKEIFESKNELTNLTKEVSTNLSGEKLKTLIEDELTTDHVKQVLEQALTKFSSAKPGMEGFNTVYAEMGAGLVFNLQLALAKLGCNFDRGIDGMYGSKDTLKRVIEFQNAWNEKHTDDIISTDGRAGEKTITKIIAALGDATWDKTKIVRVTTDASAGDNKQKETKPLTKEEALKDPAANHLMKKTVGGVDMYVPEKGYEFVNPADSTNYTTKPTVEKQKALDEQKKKEKEKAERKKDKSDEKKVDKTEKKEENKDAAKTEKKVDQTEKEKTSEKKEQPAKKLDKKLEKKYDDSALYFESILNDKKYNPVDKVLLVEKRVAEDLDPNAKETWPAADSKFATLRQKVYDEAVAYLNTLALPDPKQKIDAAGMKKIEENFETLHKHRKNIKIETPKYRESKLGGLNLQADKLMSGYMGRLINEAFTGSKIDTKSFKLFLTDSDNVMQLQSYGNRTQVDISKKKIKDLNVTFKDRGETLRAANLINYIKGQYKPRDTKEARFNLSPTGEIEQNKAGDYNFDKDIVRNYDLFPTLKGKINNQNKRALVDYLNKNLGDVETKFMTQKQFQEKLPAQVGLWNDLTYEKTFKDYMNQLTVRKIARAVANVQKEGYVITDIIRLDSTNKKEDYGHKDDKGNFIKEGETVLIDMTASQEKIEAYLRTQYKNPKLEQQKKEKQGVEKKEKADKFKEKMIKKVGLKARDKEGKYYENTDTKKHPGTYIFSGEALFYAGKGSKKREQKTTDGDKWIDIK